MDNNLPKFNLAVQQAMTKFLEEMKAQGYEPAEYYHTDLFDHDLSKRKMRNKKTGMTVRLDINFPKGKNG